MNELIIAVISEEKPIAPTFNASMAREIAKLEALGFSVPAKYSGGRSVWDIGW